MSGGPARVWLDGLGLFCTVFFGEPPKTTEVYCIATCPFQPVFMTRWAPPNRGAFVPLVVVGIMCWHGCHSLKMQNADGTSASATVTWL